MLESSPITICQNYPAGSTSPQMKRVGSAESRSLSSHTDSVLEGWHDQFSSEQLLQFDRTDAFHLRAGRSRGTFPANTAPLFLLEAKPAFRLVLPAVQSHGHQLAHLDRGTWQLLSSFGLLQTCQNPILAPGRSTKSNKIIELTKSELCGLTCFWETPHLGSSSVTGEIMTNCATSC